MPDPAIWNIVVWLFAIGAAVGSFLNVVVYRLPLGLSIVHPPSHCPKCGKPIAWYDNVPILGWIVLRGRCRKCHNPISARYPIVEAITAAMFAVVAIVELPYVDISNFYIIYPCHMLLLCTLLCAGLIEYDGQRPPWRLFVPALVVGLVTPFFYHNLPATPVWLHLSTGLTGAANSLAGLAVGGTLGGIAWGLLSKEKPRGLMLGLICVGLFFGWLPVTIIGWVTAVLVAPMWLPERVSPRLRIPSSMILGIVTLGWIVVPTIAYYFALWTYR